MPAPLDFAAIRVQDENGNPVSGAKAYFYQPGTTTPITVYQDSSLTTPHAPVVVADAEGTFPAVYYNGNFKVSVTDADDAVLPGYPVDNLVGSIGTLSAQDGDNVAITGGAIDNTEIGQTTPAPGAFTTLESDTLTVNGHNYPSTGQIGDTNVIINGAFQVNQRGHSSGAALAADSYGHDRWKSGASGCTYSWATVENETTVTITAGTLGQIVAGENLVSGTYVITWEGTAQARVNGGTYGDSGMTATITGGANTFIEFGTGTVKNVAMRPGTVALPFVRRSLRDESRESQRYYWRKWNDQTPSYLCTAGCYNTSVCLGYIDFPVEMRVAPTGGYSAIGDFAFLGSNTEKSGNTNMTFIEDTFGSRISMSSTWSLTQGDGGAMVFKSTAAATAYIDFDAELYAADLP